MTNSNYNDLMKAALREYFPSPFEQTVELEEIATKNKSDLSSYSFSEEIKLPTSSDLAEIKQWYIDYKKRNPSFSKRKIRNDTKKHFNIQIINPCTHYK